MTVFLKLIDREYWQRHAPSFLDYNYRQLWDFGMACAKRIGAVSEHVAVYDGTELVGLADVRVKRIPFLGTGIAYINGGPLVRRADGDANDQARLKILLIELANVYVYQKKNVLRVQPTIGSETWNNRQIGTFMESGFVVSEKVRPYRTFVTDIAGPLEEIRKKLNQKWRNCLNNSEKRGLTIKTGTNGELFSVFCDLYKTLIDRKEFDVDLTPEFYRQVQENLAECERFLISIVYDDDQPVAGHVSSLLGDTSVYLLGATNTAGLANKAAYLVQWAVIQMAKERGCCFYDLGGIDPDRNPGVYHFKKGIGGFDITAPGPFECYPDGFTRFLVNGCENAFRMMRRLRNA